MHTKWSTGKGIQAKHLPHLFQRTKEGRAMGRGSHMGRARLSVSPVTNGGLLESSSSAMSRFGGTTEGRC